MALPSYATAAAVAQEEVAEKAAAPPPAPIKVEPEVTEYGISIDKGNDDMSVAQDLEGLGGTLRVKSISSTHLLQYNMNAAAAQQIKVGDFILDVNGQRDDAEKMLETINCSSKVAMKFRHPLEFTINIDKARWATFGVGLDYHADGTSMMITEVRAGPFQEWNQTNAGKEVKAQDRIIAVNGMTGMANALCEAMLGAQKPFLQIARPK